MEADNTHVFKWWVGAEFDVHPDMKSHNVYTMSSGNVSIYYTSINQKLNNQKSTEEEIVDVVNVLPLLLWTRYFLKYQGYKVDDSDIF